MDGPGREVPGVESLPEDERSDPDPEPELILSHSLTAAPPRQNKLFPQRPAEWRESLCCENENDFRVGRFTLFLKHHFMVFLLER